MAIASLPTPLPIGTIAEYQEDPLAPGEWIQVAQGTGQGNVLIIPSQLYRPVGPRDTYHQFDAQCLSGFGTITNVSTCCVQLIHDANLGAWFEGVSSCGGNQIEDCPSKLHDPLQGDGTTSPYDAMLAIAAACNGTPLIGGCNPNFAYPSWFLDEFRAAGMLPPEREALGFLFDMATIWCAETNLVVLVTNPLIPLAGACPPGDVAQGATGCPTGYFVDPASPACCKQNVIDPPLPRGLHNLAGETRGLRPHAELMRMARRTRAAAGAFMSIAPGPRTPPPAILAPALPLGAEMPLPAGNCGCEWASEEMEL